MWFKVMLYILRRIKYYIEVPEVFTFLKNSKQFLLSSEKDGNKHIYLYEFGVQNTALVKNDPKKNKLGHSLQRAPVLSSEKQGLFSKLQRGIGM